MFINMVVLSGCERCVCVCEGGVGTDRVLSCLAYLCLALSHS
jgi:hypothetical protein